MLLLLLVCLFVVVVFVVVVVVFVFLFVCLFFVCFFAIVVVLIVCLSVVFCCSFLFFAFFFFFFFFFFFVFLKGHNSLNIGRPKKKKIHINYFTTRKPCVKIQDPSILLSSVMKPVKSVTNERICSLNVFRSLEVRNTNYNLEKNFSSKQNKSY